MEIAKEDKVKCFDFLSEFEKTIKPNFGSYNINDDHLSRFLNENKIFLGKTNKADRAKALKSRYYIVFEQTKPCGKDNDVVHHLLRHIRNAIAHGHIIKKGNNKFYIEDMKETGIMTMEGNIAKNEFFLLLEQLKLTRA
jgi:hypothetical protein